VPTLSDGECRAFLAEGTRTGKLATVRADGRAQVTPVWFVLDAGAHARPRGVIAPARR
jgi:Pyridoxamine 5'-phosphate oxidase